MGLRVHMFPVSPSMVMAFTLNARSHILLRWGTLGPDLTLIQLVSVCDVDIDTLNERSGAQSVSKFHKTSQVAQVSKLPVVTFCIKLIKKFPSANTEGEGFLTCAATIHQGVRGSR